MERIQKVISNSGYCSRRKAEELINEGKVFVNDSKATIGMQVTDKDIIRIGNDIIKKDCDNKVYYLLNKPRGVVTTSSDDKGRKTVVDLIDTDKRIYPVGRLDYDTTGVLILTNDGELTNKLTHPSSNIDKVYMAKIEGIMTGSDITRMKNGLVIDDYKTSPCMVKLQSYDKKTKTSLVRVTIHEGHNHQVKKMFEAVGYSVKRLSRIRFAHLDVKSLKSGEYRELTIKEVKQLYGLLADNKKDTKKIKRFRNRNINKK